MLREVVVFCLYWDLVDIGFLLLAVVLLQMTLPVPYVVIFNVTYYLWVDSLMSLKIEPILNHIGFL